MSWNICTNIIEENGGRLKFHSDDDKGSAVMFSMKMHQYIDDVDGASNSRSSSKGSYGKYSINQSRIGLLEDSQPENQVLQEINTSDVKLEERKYRSSLNLPTRSLD